MTRKSNLDCTQITVSGTHIFYPGNVGTKTAPLKLVNFMINSVSRAKNQNSAPSTLATSTLVHRLTNLNISEYAPMTSPKNSPLNTT